MLWEGVSTLGEVSAAKGVSAPGGVCSRGVACLLWGGVSLGGVSQHAVRQTPLL